MQTCASNNKTKRVAKLIFYTEIEEGLWNFVLNFSYIKIFLNDNLNDEIQNYPYYNEPKRLECKIRYG